MSLVVAVIPTYRPEADTLLPLTRALREADVPVLVSDDGSRCTADPVLAAAQRDGATVIRHRRNAGIARGLNDGYRFAAAARADWLLTLDQDSRLPVDYLTRLFAGAGEAVTAMGAARVGAIAPGRIDDASGQLSYPVIEGGPFPTTHEVIQSGSLWSMSGLDAIGGFDESFGIDAVDAAACVRLRAVSRQLVLLPDLSIGHSLGSGQQVKVLGRTVLASGHSAQRRTSIVRNRLRLLPEEVRQSPLHAVRTMRRLVMGTALAVTIEEDRLAKLRASLQGLRP